MPEYDRNPKRVSAWQVPFLTVLDSENTPGHPFTDTPGWLTHVINGGIAKPKLAGVNESYPHGQWYFQITAPGDQFSGFAYAGDWILCDADATLSVLADHMFDENYTLVEGT